MVVPEIGDVSVDTLSPRDWEAIRRIYAEGIATGNATFETAAPSWRKFDAAHLLEPRLVARGPHVLGWAALSSVSARAAYRGVAEVSVYVASESRGRGVGAALLTALVAHSEDAGIWTLQAGIFPENAASLALHARCGFREVGRRERIGRLAGVWRDVVLLERRSDRVGAEESEGRRG
jgi:L-amino acid N-acyltransferase YncA